MSNNVSRRIWLGRTAAALGATSLASGQPSAAANDTTSSVVEPSRTTDIVRDVDVLVCGGGPAGVSAAISAARAGASVQILECHGCLGGVWTSGMLSYVIDAGKPGFNRELIDRLALLDPNFTEHDPRKHSWKSYMYDVETMKFLLESLCSELGIGIQLHTRVVDVEINKKRRLQGVISESKSGRQAWRSHVVIDATGDGDVGALAGCDFEIGKGAEEEGCPCQPMSLMGVISAPKEVLVDFSTAVSSANKDRLFNELARAGVEPSYAKPTIWHMGGPVAVVMLNHEYGVRPDNAAAITEATIRARRELFEIVQALRRLEAWNGTRLLSTAEQIGVRDGRRLRGRNTVTVSDIVAGARSKSNVCTSSFCVDVHALSKSDNRVSAYGNAGVKAKPFDIPLGAMIAADVDHLMMAGRCISGDFFAHASYRVTGNAVAMGEYAGATAALAAAGQIAPHEVAYSDIDTTVASIRSQNNAL